MDILFNAFLHGLLVGAILASTSVVIYLLFLKVKNLQQDQNTEH